MPSKSKKETKRIIYEACLGRPIRNYQWSALKEQMKASNLPLTIDNLRFAAKCKNVGPKRSVDAIALNCVMKVFCDLGETVCGIQLKEYVFKTYPTISRDKFYRAFRNTGAGFQGETEYRIKELGETLYLLFSKRLTG